MVNHHTPDSDDDRPRPDNAHIDRTDGDALVHRAVQRYGFAGAMLAGGMVAFDRLLGRREREDPPVIAETPDEPTDIDRDGIVVQVDESTTVVARAPEPTRGPVTRITRRRRTRPS